MALLHFICKFFSGAAISYAAHALAIGFANTLALFILH